MKIFTRMATVLSVLCAVAAAVFMAAVFPGDSDAATVERGKDMKTDDDGHVLVALWKEYEAARSADLPQKEADALDKIMKEALGQNLTWDYYDAAVKWFNAVTSRNWKLYDRSRLRIMDDAGVLSDPVVDYSLMRSGLLDGAVDMEWFSANVLEKAAYLKKNCSRAFYAKDAALVPSMYCPAFIIPLISNDYEYLLWSVFQYGRSWRNSDVADAARKELENYLEGSYPSGTFLEYLSVLDGQGGADLKDCAGSADGMSGDRLKDILEERRTAFEDFAAEYGGKAVALYARAQVLMDRKSFLDMGLAGMYGISAPESSDYVTLREDCGAFEKMRKSFRGQEKNVSECITFVSDLAEGLDAENVSLYTDEYTVGVVFRNVAAAQLELRRNGMDGETVHTAGIENPYAGYYLPDTVKYKLPAIPDGDYVLVCRYGKEETALSYPVSSLSVAQRTVRDSGCGIYLAWQKSGRPVEKADIEILSKGDTVLTVKDFEFDGFTSLQDVLDEVSAEHDGALTIRCSFIDDEGLYRRSPDLFLPESGLKPLSSGSTAGQEPARRLAARIFKDRGAFNPGDSVQFKVVLYSYSGVSDCAVQAGRDIKVWLTDPDGRTVSEMTLKTNGFGSADGSFLLPETLKGGTYYISVNVSGSYGFIARSALTVDEFVLPTYTMEFEDGKDVWFSGDTVVVRGRLSSYSGHPVSSARIEYTVESYVSGASPLRGETEAGDDGSFEIRFKAWTPDGDGDRLYFCYPSVKVTDLTGETYEWSAGPVYVNPGMTVFTHLRNEAEGSVDMLPGAAGDGDVALMSCDTAIISFSLTSSLPECPVEYEIIHNGRHIMSGSVMSGDETAVDLSGQPSGIYCLKARSVYTRSDGRRLEAEDEMYMLKVSASDTVMDFGVESFFRKMDDGRVSALVGVGDGRQWYVVEVYDATGRLLKSEIVMLEGRNGKEDSVRQIGYDFDMAWTDAVSMRIFGFRNGDSRSVMFTYSRSDTAEWNLPLEFTRFVDMTLPGSAAVFSLKTLPGVECAVSVYDRSTDNIRSNRWSAVRFSEPSPVYVRVRSQTGRTGYVHYEEMIPFQLVEGSSMNLYGAHPVMRTKSAADINAEMLEEAAVSDAGESGDARDDVTVRSRFDKTLAFLPSLLSDSDGNVEFNVDVTDRLSTYYVSVFAHDRQMRNSVLGREMLVSLPVKVSVVEPRFLYEGDRYCLKASVSNSSENTLAGEMALYVYGSKDYMHSDPVDVRSVSLTAGAGSAASAEFCMDVPSDLDTLGFKIVYTAELDGVSVSDAMFVSVPVLKTVQTLSEAHSTVLLPGMDTDSLKRSLEGAFTGVSPYGAGYKEISIMDMLMESVPRKTEPQSKDVLALTEAFYMRKISSAVRYGSERQGTDISGCEAADTASRDDIGLEESIFACRNRDGGFGWFEGFPSSPVITAVVLERFASLIDRGLYNFQAESEVAYLDSLQFCKDRPSWYGGISLQQYLYVRSMYNEIPLMVSVSGKDLKEFTGRVRDYLLPKQDRGLDDNILAKARRAAVLISLSRPESESLALSFGLKKRDLKKMRSSAEADILSLSEYAVQHPSGGMYFPNAVMPFRALLESEVYAHSMLCDLMQRYSDETAAAAGPDGHTDGSLSEKAGVIAEGVRLWLMIQKETQQWDADPAYVNAVTAVLDGSDAVKSTRIAVMSKRYEMSFDEIVSAGNGMTIERQWYRVVSGISAEEADSLSRIRPSGDADGRRPVRYGTGTWLFPVMEGDTLETGDKVVAQYRIWSQENRSFVRLVSPYYAALRPVDQLSGSTGGWFRPVIVSGAGVSRISVTPSGYREVKYDRTIYCFDVCPEENISFNEEFYVTQAGTFTAPAVTVECLYSPHYRANGAASAELRSE